MATIQGYDTRGGKRYAVRYRTPQRTTTMKRGFRTKRDAAEFASTVEVEKMSGTYVQPSLGQITVAELAPQWLAKKESHVAKSNYRMLESAWRIHVEKEWGTTRIADIDLNAVEQWIGVMRRKSGATTVIRSYGVLAAILDDAVKARRLASNPARGVENLPSKSPQRHVYLQPDDVARLANESGQHRALVLTLAYCGIRWGEAVALRVSDVQFLRRRLSVRDNAVQLGVDFAVGQTKGREERSVPVPGFVLQELSRQVEGRAPSDLVFGDGVHYLPRPKSTDGWFAGAVKRAKVTNNAGQSRTSTVDVLVAKPVQTLTPHDLRHTCASIAISSGVNVLALSRMLGHKDPSVTLRVYADLFDEDLDVVAQAIDLKCAQSVLKAGSGG